MYITEKIEKYLDEGYVLLDTENNMWLSIDAEAVPSTGNFEKDIKKSNEKNPVYNKSKEAFLYNQSKGEFEVKSEKEVAKLAKKYKVKKFKAVKV